MSITSRLSGGRTALALAAVLVVSVVGESSAKADINDNRERLMGYYGAIRGFSGDGAWSALSENQRMTFLTITHRLGTSWMNDGSTMLDHITRLYTIPHGWTCGGGDVNRLFMSMDDTLLAALAGKTIPYWGDSTDPMGPHSPFQASRQTNGGSPRGQVHFFYPWWAGGVYSGVETRVWRYGLEEFDGTLDPYMLEMDLDFNIHHDSSPTCDYGTFGPEERGWVIYERNYGAIATGWAPSSYHGAIGNDCGGYDSNWKIGDGFSRQWCRELAEYYGSQCTAWVNDGSNVTGSCWMTWNSGGAPLFLWENGWGTWIESWLRQ